MMAEGLDGVCVQLPSWTLAGNRHVLGIYQTAVHGHHPQVGRANLRTPEWLRRARTHPLCPCPGSSSSYEDKHFIYLF